MSEEQNLTPPELAELTEAIAQRIQMIVCYTKCWSCQFGEHDKEWHTWADEDDIAHAANTGQPDPSDTRCGCYCQRNEKNDT